MGDEMLQCFDEQGNPSAIHPRSEVKMMPPRWWYGTACVWLVNDQGEIMVSKRAIHLSANPGMWQSWFGGHVGAGDSFVSTAQRELAEEAGLDLPIDNFFLVDRVRSDEKKVFSEKFALRFNGEPSELRFADGEVAEVKWMKMEDAWAEKEAYPDRWANGCNPEHRERIRQWLKTREVN